MTWKSTVVISGLTLVATWLGWTSTPPSPAPAPRTTSSARVAAPRGAADRADIQQEAARLHVRLRDQTDYKQPTRNPFRFAPKREPVRVEAVQPIIEAPPPPSAPAPPPLTLAGIASDGDASNPRRTAVLSTPAGVLIVKEGDMIGDAYRVVRIAEEMVEVSRTADDSRIELRWNTTKSQIPTTKAQ